MSLRSRLLAAMLVIALLLVGTGVLVTCSIRAHLVGQIDQQLAQTARLAPTVLGERGRPRPSSGLSSLYVAVIADDRTVETRATPDLVASSAAAPDWNDPRLAATTGAGSPITVESVDGDVRYRAVSLGSTQIQVVFAAPLTEVDATVRRLALVQLLAIAAAIGVLLLIGSWVMRFGVRPINRMTEAARAIGEGDLSRRVPEEVATSEAGVLGRALNRMLERIENAMSARRASEDRLRRFVADASHELRTPIATIRGYAELYRTGGLEDAGARDDAMRRTEQEAIRMGSLVDDLLLLARLDEGRPLERSRVDLVAVVSDLVGDAETLHAARSIEADVPPEVVPIIGDELRLRQVVSNLIANALTHTPDTARIRVRLFRDASNVVLTVADDGPGMSTQDVSRATERFYRADPSRTRARGGSGLGLSIVEAIVSAHEGTFELDSGIGEGTVVTLTFPDPDEVTGAGAGNVGDDDT